MSGERSGVQRLEETAWSSFTSWKGYVITMLHSDENTAVTATTIHTGPTGRRNTQQQGEY